MTFPPLFAPRRSLATDGGMPLNTRSTSVLGAGAAANPRGREVAALLLWTVAVFLSLALASFDGDPATGVERGANWVGPVGSACAHGLVSLIGLVGWALPLEALLLGIPLVRGRKSLLTPARFAGDLLIVLTAAALVQVAWPARIAFGSYRASGVVGELSAVDELLHLLGAILGDRRGGRGDQRGRRQRRDQDARRDETRANTKELHRSYPHE